MQRLISFIACLFCLFAGACASKQENVAVAYLRGAERQVETDEQRAEIRKALQDLLNLPAREALLRRYADYQGNAGAWSAVQLLHRYYVPPKPIELDEGRFYRDVATPEAREILQRCLTELN